MTHSDNFSMLTKVSESNITKLQLGQFSLKTIKLDLRASKIYNFGSIEEKYQSEIMDYKPMLPKIID